MQFAENRCQPFRKSYRLNFKGYNQPNFFRAPFSDIQNLKGPLFASGPPSHLQVFVNDPKVVRTSTEHTDWYFPLLYVFTVSSQLKTAFETQFFQELSPISINYKHPFIYFSLWFLMCTSHLRTVVLLSAPLQPNFVPYMYINTEDEATCYTLNGFEQQFHFCVAMLNQTLFAFTVHNHCKQKVL